MKQKLTYSFPVTITENGKETTYEVGFLRLRRSQQEESDLFYSKVFHKRLSEGIQPAAVLQRRILDQGGVYNSEHSKKYEEIISEVSELESEWARLASDIENKEKNIPRITEINAKLSILSEQAKEYDLSRFDATEHTAESYAANETVRYIALNCAVIKKSGDEKAEFLPFFKGKSYEEKLVDFDEKEESENEIYIKALPKLYIAAALARIGIQDPEAVKKQIEQRTGEVNKQEVVEEVKNEPPTTA